MKIIYTPLVLFLLSSGVRSFAAQVTTEYDHSANFSQYEPIHGSKCKLVTLWADRIQQTLKRNSHQRGIY